MINMTIENHGYDSFDPSTYWWKVNVSNVEYAAVFLFTCHKYLGFQQMLSNKILNGGKVNGAIAFEIPIQHQSFTYSLYYSQLFTTYSFTWVRTPPQQLPPTLTQAVVHVQYVGMWQGSYEVNSNFATNTNWNGTGDKMVTLTRTFNTYGWEISATATKQDNSNNLLTISVEKSDGTVLTSQSTSDAYGTAFAYFSDSDL